MDKSDKNKKNKQAELASLFEDLQDTLSNSIMNESTEAQVKPDISTAKNSKTHEDIQTPVKKAAVGVKERENPRENTEPIDFGDLDALKETKKEPPPQTQTENIKSEDPPVSPVNNEFTSIFDDIKGKAKTPEKTQEEPAKIFGSRTKLDIQENRQQEQESLLEALSGEHSDYAGKYEVELPAVSNKSVKPKNTPNTKKSSPEKKFNGLFRVSAKEYTSREQNDNIFKEYQKIYIGEIIRLIACGLFFLALIYLEIAPFIDFLKLPDELVFYSSVYILIDLQILLFAAWITQKSLIFGLKSILKSELNLYAAATIFFIFAAAHSIAAYFLKANTAQTILFNSVAVLAMFCISLYNILDIDFEITGFKAVSAKKLKYTFRLDTNASDERELFKDVVPQNMTVGRISKTAFASNFFSRTARYKNHGESAKFYIYIGLAAAVVMTITYIIMKREIYQIFSAAAFLFLGSMPLCAFISAAYPSFRAQRKAQASGAAFIGADSIAENAEIAILSIADRDIFPPSVKLARVRVYGNNTRLDDVMNYLYALFSELNLPASEIFKTQVDWDAKKAEEANVQINELSDYGICYTANSATLYAGKSEYIEHLGHRLPVDDPDFDEQFLKSSGSMMFLASEIEVIAKIYLKYELTSNFHDILKSIRKMNSCACIKTFDPNIDDALLHKLANIKKSPIKVLKLKDMSEVYQISEKTESGIVSKDSLKSIISTLLIANRTKTAMKTNALIQGIGFAISLIATVCIILFGSAEIYNAGILVALQLFWAATITFLSALST